MKILGLEIKWASKVTACKYNPPYSGDLIRGPHCDPFICHAPFSGCDYCDETSGLQAERIHKGINFTGQSHPGRETCPAEQLRALDAIYSWPGNRPMERDASAGYSSAVR